MCVRCASLAGQDAQRQSGRAISAGRRSIRPFPRSVARDRDVRGQAPLIGGPPIQRHSRPTSSGSTPAIRWPEDREIKLAVAVEIGGNRRVGREAPLGWSTGSRSNRSRSRGCTSRHRTDGNCQVGPAIAVEVSHDRGVGRQAPLKVTRLVQGVSELRNNGYTSRRLSAGRRPGRYTRRRRSRPRAACLWTGPTGRSPTGSRRSRETSSGCTSRRLTGDRRPIQSWRRRRSPPGTGMSVDRPHW